jgi:N4-gp56 family major capsid protein
MVPLGNTGVTPASQTLTAVDIDAKIGFYGTYIVLNEQVTLQSQDPVLNEAVARLGIALRQSEDQLTRDMLAATSAFINCVNGNNADNPTELTAQDISDVVRTLLGNNAYTILDNIEGQNKFATGPVRDAYFALGHTDMSSVLEGVNNFIQKANYPSPTNALRSEWGAVRNLRWLLSSIASKTANASNLNATVYNNFCVGMEAYACIEQDGYSSSFIYRPPIFDGPLALNASVGYKFAEVSRILNDLWVLNLRCTLPV